MRRVQNCYRLLENNSFSPKQFSSVLLFGTVDRYVIHTTYLKIWRVLRGDEVSGVGRGGDCVRGVIYVSFRYDFHICAISSCHFPQSNDFFKENIQGGFQFAYLKIRCITWNIHTSMVLILWVCTSDQNLGKGWDGRESFSGMNFLGKINLIPGNFRENYWLLDFFLNIKNNYLEFSRKVYR